MGELRTTRKGLTKMTLTDAENTPASIYDGVCLDQWGTGATEKWVNERSLYISDNENGGRKQD
jgi:hypothetical protein